MMVDSKLQNMSLKRDLQGFHSTARHTVQSMRTMPKPTVKPTLGLQASLPVKSRTEEPPPEKKKDKIDATSILESIAINIVAEEVHSKAEITSKFMRHFYYRAVSRVVKQPLQRTPKAVHSIYSEMMEKRLDNEEAFLAFNHGYLKNASCVYYSIENTIIFFHIEDLLSTEYNEDDIPFTIHEVRGQVINVF